MQRFEVQFPAIFIVFGNESKSCSKLVINQVAGALGISNQFYWLKSLMGTEFFSPCRPPSFWLWRRRRRRRMFQKVALNRLKIEQQVAQSQLLISYMSWFSMSKLLWVQSHFKSDFFSDNYLLNWTQHLSDSLKIAYKLSKACP